MHCSQQASAAAGAATNAAHTQETPTRQSVLASTATLLAQPDQELDKLLTSYRASFRPADAHEDFLVSEVAVADWRTKYLARVEKGVMHYMMASTHSQIVADDKADHWKATHPLPCPHCGNSSQFGPREEVPEPPLLADMGPEFQTMMMGSAWVNNEKAFALLHRYQTQARRDYYKALKQLEHVRSGKAAYMPKQTPEAKAEEAAKASAATQAAAASAAQSSTPQKNGTNPPAASKGQPADGSVNGSGNNNTQPERNEAKKNCQGGGLPLGEFFSNK